LTMLYPCWVRSIPLVAGQDFANEQVVQQLHGSTCHA